MKRLELEHDNLWAALTYARDAPDPLVAARLGVGLGWYFGTAGRVSEGRAFIEAGLESADAAPLPLRVELLAYVCYLATEEDDLEAAVEAGKRGLALAAKSDAPWETAMLRLALAFACARAGPLERAVALADEARRAFDELGDTWGAASSAVTGAVGALRRGDLATSSALVAEAVRLHADYEVGRAGGAARGLVGRAARRRGGGGRRVPPGARAFRTRRLRRSRFVRALGPRFGRLRERELRRGRAQYRRALLVADAASASWLVAHVKARLAQVGAAVGDAESAATLYRGVVAWSREPRRHDAREALFIALVGSPATAALVGLAELADARGDGAAADELRAEAGLASA